MSNTLSQFQDTLTQSFDTLRVQSEQMLSHSAESAHIGHLPPLISDLALILIVAASVTLLFRKLKQPLVLGYIIAGFFVGPHLSLTPSVVDLGNVKTLAEIGVIFLLFSLGLEFSFKKLVRVGGSASITALFEIVFITLAGYFTGKALGWSTMDCLFLGGMLASSSTTIILKAFDDLGVKTKNYARIVFGVLVVEDIVVILLMVLLSTVAVTQHFEGTEMLFTIGKLLFFLILWFLMGIFIIPTLLKKVKKLLDDETYLILSIGLCLVMVVVATQVGFSAELGAFIMGSILAETTSAERIEHLFKPVKDLFGAVFFVSVGMMIDPNIIVEYGWIVLVVTLLTIFGKFFATTAGAILSGQSLRQAVQVGMSMAQIGEFAFIVATLGMSLGVISDFLFPVAVGASAITTFTTPYMVKYSDKIYAFIQRIMPLRLQQSIEKYAAGTQTIQAESEWRHFVRMTLSSLITNATVSFALMVMGVRLLLPFLMTALPNELTARVLSFALTSLVALPFLWALMFRKHNDMAYRELWAHESYKNGPLLIIESSRIFLGMFLLGYLVAYTFSTLASAFIVVPLTIVTIVLFSKHIKKFYGHIEGRFISNLNSREIAEQARQQAAAESSSVRHRIASKENLSTWDAHLVDLIVPQDAAYVGRKLSELSWTDRYGIGLVYIKRGEKLFFAPGPDAKILPFDHIGFIASDEQAQAFRPVLEEKENLPGTNYDVDDIVLEKFVVDAHNHFDGLSIKDCRIREKTNGIIIGLERDDLRLPNPPPDTLLQQQDIVWIVGEKTRIKQIKNPDSSPENS